MATMYRPTPHHASLYSEVPCLYFRLPDSIERRLEKLARAPEHQDLLVREEISPPLDRDEDLTSPSVPLHRIRSGESPCIPLEDVESTMPWKISFVEAGRRTSRSPESFRAPPNGSCH